MHSFIHFSSQERAGGPEQRCVCTLLRLGYRETHPWRRLIQAACDVAFDYVHTRKQFGTPVG
ncbi:hypothetical protein FHG87_025606, partial [Trinorchestia longiramus]